MSDFSDLEIPPRLWELIDQARGDETKMRTILSALSREDLLLFYKEYSFAVSELEGYFEGCDVEVPDFLNSEAFGWIVSQGRAFCERLHDHPELIQNITPDQINWSAVFGGLALVVYEDKYGEEMPDLFRIQGRWPN